MITWMEELWFICDIPRIIAAIAKFGAVTFVSTHAFSAICCEIRGLVKLETSSFHGVGSQLQKQAIVTKTRGQSTGANRALANEDVCCSMA